MSQTNYVPSNILPLSFTAPENWFVLDGTTSATPSTAQPLLTLYTVPSNGVLVSRALIKSASANTVPVTFGPTSSGNSRTLNPGDEYELSDDHTGDFDLSIYYTASTGASQAVSVLTLSDRPAPTHV